ncbi:MAG TPA: type II secretion system protein GspE, partial [Rudaea sp.]|nr:type II secretion system protein GspE [Rudaea sp.]
VRVLDPTTRESYAVTPRELAAFGKSADTRASLYRPSAQAAGRHGGYRGRTGIYEYVPVDEELRRLIHANAAEADMERHARTRTPSILDDGWNKCIAGVTSAEEVLRVTREE